MAIGFPAKYAFKKELKIPKEIFLEKAEVVLNELKYKITKRSDYMVSGIFRIRNIFLKIIFTYVSGWYVNIRITENDDVIIESESPSLFFDFGTNKKRVHDIIDKLNHLK